MNKDQNQQTQGVPENLPAGSEQQGDGQRGRRNHKPELIVERSADADPERPYALITIKPRK